jgi:4a-hydroxytetrahydrobiopterin dehydratase
MATPLLTDDELNAALKDLPDWVRAGAEITRTVEAANHHPDIDIRWRRVTFTLSTHSAGGLTGLDISMAHEIDRLARES